MSYFCMIWICPQLDREALLLDLLICLKKVGGGWWLRLGAALTIPTARDLFYESATTRYERNYSRGAQSRG